MPGGLLLGMRQRARVAGNVVPMRGCAAARLKWAVAVGWSGRGSACRTVPGRNHW